MQKDDNVIFHAKVSLSYRALIVGEVKATYLDKEAYEKRALISD